MTVEDTVHIAEIFGYTMTDEHTVEQGIGIMNKQTEMCKEK
jgi:hypothetical protein